MNTTSFLDPNAEIEIKQGIIPHWQQRGIFYFVTFRFADSIPNSKKDELKADREKWNKKHKETTKYSKEDWRNYNQLFNERMEKWLNAG